MEKDQWSLLGHKHVGPAAHPAIVAMSHSVHSDEYAMSSEAQNHSFSLVRNFLHLKSPSENVPLGAWNCHLKAVGL